MSLWLWNLDVNVTNCMIIIIIINNKTVNKYIFKKKNNMNSIGYIYLLKIFNTTNKIKNKLRKNESINISYNK